MIEVVVMSGRDPLPARPVRRALTWLLVLGVLFYSSYGFANWLASQRESVPSIVFEWERQVPFLAWTIVPYWTTNLFYAASLFLCRTREALDTHAKRLLTVQLVAISCFLMFPLKFSFAKPEVTGPLAVLYDALGAFDQPFNQAPSLHIALTVVLTAFYIRLLSPLGSTLFVGWSLLVGVSVLTTFQHHFIDVPTGAALGLFCLWLWPFGRPSPLTAWQRTTDRHSIRLALGYGSAAALVAAVALLIAGWALWLLWPALALLLVALAYVGIGPALFAKDEAGRLGWPGRLLLWPYLACAWLNSRLWTFRHPAPVKITEDVHVGRFPAAADLTDYGAVIDLTAEFQRAGLNITWRSFPMLDLVAPDPTVLRAAADAVERLRGVRPVLVCCALGYGRSMACLATWLLRSGQARSLTEAIATLTARQPNLVLSTQQKSSIVEAARAQRC